jgi:hypothetical protein
VRTDEVDICKLRAYRALRVARALRRKQSRPDWRICVAFQLKEAAQMTRRAARLQLEERHRWEAHQARQLAEAMAEPLAPWELELREISMAQHAEGEGVIRLYQDTGRGCVDGW